MDLAGPHGCLNRNMGFPGAINLRAPVLTSEIDRTS
jgi:hypothetical protein